MRKLTVKRIVKLKSIIESENHLQPYSDRALGAIIGGCNHLQIYRLRLISNIGNSSERQKEYQLQNKPILTSNQEN
jgi:hypothetical protein